MNKKIHLVGWMFGALGTIALGIYATITLHGAPEAPTEKAAAHEGAHATFRLHTNIRYLGDSEPELLDTYEPKGAAAVGTHTAIIFLHGGGMERGDKSQARRKNIGQKFAEMGFVLVSVNYRLGNGSWPRNLYDCKNAVRYVRSHARQLHVDPSRIAIMGESAGAYLALMSALTSDEPEFEPTAPFPGVSDSVCAVIEFYGNTDLWALREKTDSPGKAAAIFGAGSETGQSYWQKLSPLSHVRAGSPPTLMFHGEDDKVVDVEQAKALDHAMEGAHVVHRLVLLPGVGHGFAFEGGQDGEAPGNPWTEIPAFLHGNHPPQ